LGGLAVAKTMLFAEGSGFDSQTQLKAIFSSYFNQVSLQPNINSSLIYTNLHSQGITQLFQESLYGVLKIKVNDFATFRKHSETWYLHHTYNSE
jgi:hypothetical protein